MTDTLSQDEIDDLLSAITKGEDINHAGFDEDVKEKKRIKAYDFKRPSKFSKEQLRTISMMHETFARLTTTSLSAQLRSIVNVHVAAVDELTYDEFIRSLSSPTTAAIVNMDPLKGSAVMELDPSITFTIIDRLLGGEGTASLTENRELSDIESSVAEMIMVRILGNMRESWSQVIDLRPRLSHIETKPQFVQIVPPGEMVVLVTLETRVEKTEGILNFCIPYITLEPIISKLSSQFWYSSSARQTTPESLKIMEERMQKVLVKLTAEIGETKLTIKEILSLKRGDIIALDNAPSNKPMKLHVGSKTKFYCRPGQIGKKIAIQIIKKIDDIYEIDIDDLILGGEDE